MWHALAMPELCLSASEFRIYLKDLANQVAAGEQRVVMARHGHRMVALVSQEDLEFLRHHKPAGKASSSSNATSPAAVAGSASAPSTQASTSAEPEIGPPGDQDLALQARRHPDSMETAEIERLYAATKDAAHVDAVWWWRLKAYTVLTLRGRCPQVPPM